MDAKEAGGHSFCALPLHAYDQFLVPLHAEFQSLSIDILFTFQIRSLHSWVRLVSLHSAPNYAIENGKLLWILAQVEGVRAHPKTSKVRFMVN